MQVEKAEKRRAEARQTAADAQNELEEKEADLARVVTLLTATQDKLAEVRARYAPGRAAPAPDDLNSAGAERDAAATDDVASLLARLLDEKGWRRRRRARPYTRRAS